MHLSGMVLFALLACSSGKNSGPLRGKLDKHQNVWLYLEQIKDQQMVAVDSVKTDEKGEFSFEGKIKEKDFYRLKISPNNYVFIVLDPKEQVVYLNPNVLLQQDYTLDGSSEGKLILEIKSIRLKINAHRDSLMNVLNTAAPADRMQLQTGMEASFNAFVGAQLGKVREIIQKNPDKLAIITAAELLDPDKDFAQYDQVAVQMKKHYPQSGFAKNFIQRVDQMRATAIGAVAPEIQLPNPDGTVIPLSSLRGNVVLIDFWASWCGPCRMENPNVVRLYNEVHGKGFEVYSVSLDKDKTAWINAIAKDGLVWKSHVSDLAYWSSSVVKQYGFSGIPFTVLIDREGKIVGKGLRGPQLEEAVKQLLP